MATQVVNAMDELEAEPTTIETEPTAGDMVGKEEVASPPTSLAGASRGICRRVHCNPHWLAGWRALDAHTRKRKRAEFDAVCVEDAALASMPLDFDDACADDDALATMPLP